MQQSDRPSGGLVAGKVAFVTGAARGQGRSHALRLAEQGADLILLDAVAPIATVDYAMPSAEDFEAVVDEARKLGARVVYDAADVRDLESMEKVVAAGLAELGRLDIVVANAGILGAAAPTWMLTEEQWHSVVDVNLNGVWNTVRASVGSMIEAGNGGSVILISSIAGLRGVPNVSHYVTAKHGLVGLAGSLANEVAQYAIRVNTVHPTNVLTPMIDNPASAKLFRPDLDAPTLQDGVATLSGINLMPVPYIEARDVTAAVLWLASEESRYVTGAAIPIDAGMLAKYTG